ncbi:hypothetical protein GGR54DRAFT_632059 [Hypoxylon sp. NC1633]|nr:hypothetical protein GGR54DRAFT_632059 [Hypoxylon sp. NC1633]
MAIEVAMNTPLADALNTVIQPKLVEVGWSSGGPDDAALSEYIILMLVNGKTQDQIAAELAGDLLNISPDDPGARDFAKWLFDQIETLNSQLNGVPTQLNSATVGGPQNHAPSGEQDTEMSTMPFLTDGPELNAPTGPKSMRNGPARGGREKRMFGQMTKAMDRSHDVLHRIRANGNERINSHRTPPTGPRGGFGRGNNRMNNRNAGLAAHLGNQIGSVLPPSPHGPSGMNGMNTLDWMMPGSGTPEQLFHMIQQQNELMTQMHQQLTQQSQAISARARGRSLHDRAQNPRGGRRGGHSNGHGLHRAVSTITDEPGNENEDVEMSQGRRELPNPETTICKFNLACTNKECKFAHQSPAAPPNTTVDVNDICSFGAACKNRKCVGRHPSPATKRAHQNEMECKFYPNCTNPNCPFKHPDMPPCRNGGDCAVEGCKFTHLQTMCKYKPCTNRFCPYKHEEGQRGTFHDKVWTADGAGGHVSERKFVDLDGFEELVVPGGESENAAQETHLQLRTTYNKHAISATAYHCTCTMASKHPENVFIRLLRSAYHTTQHSARTGISNPPVSRHLSSPPRTIPNSPLSLRSTYAPIEISPRAWSRTFATAKPQTSTPRDIAVLGGGITGLTAVHYLARYAPDSNITLYEGSGRLGGWVDGEKVRVGDGEDDTVLFQRGPRMLRSGASSLKYDDLVLYDVLANLKMQGELYAPNEDFVNNRYMYYPDHLVKLPTFKTLNDTIESIGSYFTEPLYDGTLTSMWSWFYNQKNASPEEEGSRRNNSRKEDESVGDFFEELFEDDRLVKNVISGMLHGIYGGDAYKLSVKHTVFDNFYRRLKHIPTKPADDEAILEWKDLLLSTDILDGPNRSAIQEMGLSAVRAKSNTYMFEDGLLSLLDGLVKDLKTFKNVTIKTNSRVTSLAYKDDQVSITTEKEPQQPKQYDKVISTIFSKHLADLVEPKGALPSLAETHAVTIMVVNLWFENPEILAQNHGFGYLVPAGTPDNDEGVLGVLFDSDISLRQDRPGGTKLTVMLGGRYWDEGLIGQLGVFPNEEAGKELALAAVQRHLGISPDERVVASARLCRDCLPQHTVGHRRRMSRAHRELLTAFHGRLSVAGPSYTTVGVVPSMRAGYDAGMRVARGHGVPYFRDSDYQLSSFWSATAEALSLRWRE